MLVPFRVVTKDKSEPTSQESLILQIDELQRISEAERTDALGANWFEQVKSFYQLSQEAGIVPSFRPKVHIPELQVLMLNEAADLSDSSPRVYIQHRNERDKAREEAFQKQWQQGFFSNHILLSILWSMFAGAGFLQITAIPNKVSNRGQVLIRSRNPESIFPDPGAVSEEDWAYVIFEDQLYPEQVLERFPETARDLPAGYAKPRAASSKQSGLSFQMLPGPMSVTGRFPPQISTGGQLGKSPLRYTFMYDYTKERMEEDAGSEIKSDLLVPAKFRLKYPNGRMIADYNGRVVFDDNNPFPLRRFPIVRVLGLPALYGFWPPPPIRFTKSLQELAGRMYTQVFENAVRVNNGVWFLPEECGIDREEFGGIPGEVQVVAANSAKLPEMRTPAPFPSHFIEYPEILLQKQRLLQGFYPSRLGEGPTGNISPELFDATLFQSQYLTRLRTRLLSESVQRASEIAFYTMVLLYPDDLTFPDFTGDEKEIREVVWKGTGGMNPEEFKILLDPGSIKPISQAAMRQLVPLLRGAGLMDARNALKLMEVPGADEIAQGIEQEQKLAALSTVSRARR